MRILKLIKTLLLWMLLSVPIACISCAVVEYVVEHGFDIYAAICLSTISWLAVYVLTIVLDAYSDEGEEPTSDEP